MRTRMFVSVTGIVLVASASWVGLRICHGSNAQNVSSTIDRTAPLPTVTNIDPLNTHIVLDAATGEPSDSAVDAETVVLAGRRRLLEKLFLQKLDRMSAAEMDACATELHAEIRELDGQLRLANIRQDLEGIRRELPETSPAKAAARMLSVPTPRIIETRIWTETPSHDDDPFALPRKSVQTNFDPRRS